MNLPDFAAPLRALRTPFASPRQPVAALLLAGLAWASLDGARAGVARLPRLPADLDAGVVLLFAPVCLLMLAILALALRLPYAGGDPSPRRAELLLAGHDFDAAD